MIKNNSPIINEHGGNKFWSLNGRLHREDGPAIEYADGDKDWYINGKLHREDGPAIEYTTGTKAWYINGKRLYKIPFIINIPNIIMIINEYFYYEDDPLMKKAIDLYENHGMSIDQIEKILNII